MPGKRKTAPAIDARPSGDTLAVGRIVRPHGVRGAMLLEPYSELASAVVAGSRVQLGEERTSATVVACRKHGARLLLPPGARERAAHPGQLAEVPADDLPHALFHLAAAPTHVTSPCWTEPPAAPGRRAPSGPGPGAAPARRREALATTVFLSMLDTSGHPPFAFPMAARAVTDAGGLYTFKGLPAGRYYAFTCTWGYGWDCLNNRGYVDEHYDNVACGRACKDEIGRGTPIAVALGVTTSGRDFALDWGGRISGTITDAVTAAPVTGACVRILRLDGEPSPARKHSCLRFFARG